MFKKLLSLVAALAIAVTAISITPTPVFAVNNCPNAKLTIYENSSAGGRSLTFTAYCATAVSMPTLNIPNLSNYVINDCNNGALIKHDNWNDCISSYKVAGFSGGHAGCNIRFHYDINYQHFNWPHALPGINGIVTNFGSSYNDSISSIRITCP